MGSRPYRTREEEQELADIMDGFARAYIMETKDNGFQPTSNTMPKPLEATWKNVESQWMASRLEVDTDSRGKRS